MIVNTPCDVSERVPAMTVNNPCDVSKHVPATIVNTPCDVSECVPATIVNTPCDVSERIPATTVNNPSLVCKLCAEGWVYNTSCYRFSTNREDWNTANQTCSNENAHLVIINSESELNFLKQQINKTRYWIGLNDIKNESDWRWVDGTEHTPTPKYWMEGEPNDKDGEDCAHFMESGYWNDLACNLQHRFICERKAESFVSLEVLFTATFK
nr:PREDICTED: CD209 antigen-like protein C [Latimeria chalumnae]|eukprot:XP_014350047.1 PREDICTED: CD209 antigen-like protein C [Latimeria chalumnae]